MIKNKENTKEKILNSLEEIIIEDGFEKIGINAIAKKASVSKILIYRYFNSLEGLIEEYISRKDYWLNYDITNIPPLSELKNFIKSSLKNQIEQEFNDEILSKIYRWELTSNSKVIKKIQEKREEKGDSIIKMLAEITHEPEENLASIGMILSSSVTYLSIVKDKCSFYNGVDLKIDGQSLVTWGVEKLIDNWFDNLEINKKNTTKISK